MEENRTNPFMNVGFYQYIQIFVHIQLSISLSHLYLYQ